MGSVGSAVSKLAIGAYDALPKEGLANEGKLLFARLETGMRQTEAGNDMANLLKNKYVPMYHAAREKLFSQYSVMPKTQQLAPHEIDSQARNIARVNTLGRNDYRGVGLIKAIEHQPGLSPLQIRMHQQTLADHVHMFLKDTHETMKGPQSVFKENVARPFSFNPTGEKKPNLNRVPLNTGAKYVPPGDNERFFTRLAQKLMLPAIAIPHIGTLLNYAINTPLTDLAKGFSDATFQNKAVKQQVADYGIFAGTVADAYAVRHYGSRGIIARATGNDTFGTIVNQLTHQPGFNALREWTLSIGAATGKHSLERFSEDLVTSGGKDKAAIYNLKKLGLDPAEVLKNKGILNPDQYRRGIFNFVDSKVFLDNTMNRSFRSGQNWFYRMGGMYHGYVGRQGAMMRDVLLKDIKSNGPVNAVQALTTLGVIFPTVGIGLKTMEMWGRGQFQGSGSQGAQDYKDLYGASGPSKALLEWVDGMSHMAAFGVATDYLRAANRHQLLSAAGGPIGNEVANLAQDTVHAVQTGDFKALGRDALEDTIPDNLGKLLAHQMLPTKKEEKARHPSSHLKKMKSLKLKKLAKIQ